MILSIERPYFAPFPGFFYKAHLSDVLVILDSVQFPRRTTWISRNRFKNNLGTLWMTVPVWKKGLGLQKISDVRICYDFRWRRKHLESLKVAYANAPYFEEHLPFWEELFSSMPERLIGLNMKIIRYLLGVLQIHTNIVLLSELGIQATGELLLLEICRRMGSFHFMAPYSARKHFNQSLFREAGIRIEYLRVPSPVYPQLWGDFVPDLSAFDLIFNCGPRARDILVRNRNERLKITSGDSYGPEDL